MWRAFTLLSVLFLFGPKTATALESVAGGEPVQKRRLVEQPLVKLAQAFETQGSAVRPAVAGAVEEEWLRARREKARAARRAAIEARLDREAEDQRMAEQREKERLTREQEDKRRLAEAQAAEERRLIEAQAAERRRLAEAQAAEQKRLAEQREKERLAREEDEKRRLAEAQAAEQKRLADQREKERLAREEEEKRRLAEAQAAEQKRLAEQREKERLAREEEEKRRLAEAQAAEQKRLADQREKERVAREEEAKRNLAEAQAVEQRRQSAALAARQAETLRLALLGATAPPPAAGPPADAQAAVPVDGPANDDAKRFVLEQRRLARERLERLRPAGQKDGPAAIGQEPAGEPGAPTPAAGSIASLAPNTVPPGASPPPQTAVDQPEVVKSVKAELKRLGCYTGALDGALDDAAKTSLSRAGEALTPAKSLVPVTSDILLLLKGRTGRLCVAAREPERPHPRPREAETPKKAKVLAREAPARRPPAEAPARAGRSRCFSFNGGQYCE